MRIFGNSNQDSVDSNKEWMAQMDENKTRWFVFLDKLEIKMQELGEAAIPELKAAFEQDSDIHKRSHHLMLSGVKGQFEQIRKKAAAVKEEKIHDLFYTLQHAIDVFHPLHDTLYSFRNACSDRENIFEDKYRNWLNLLDQTSVEDLEIRYQHILNEYAAIKDKFTCTQCGGSLSLDKIFFISTYITCPHCHTQNTFEPSTQARQLEHLGRSLAEQRCAHLLQAHAAEQEKERGLYHQIHKMQLGNIHETDKNELVRKNDLIAALEKERQEAIAAAPRIYAQYLRAMFDEWNKIVPDLQEQNEKFYQRLLADHRLRRDDG